MGGDEGKDIQREAVDGSERVPPFVNCCQRGRGVMIKLRDLIQSDATKESVCVSFRQDTKIFRNVRWRKAVRFSSLFKAKTS
jgi:hypothetical protein